MLVEKIPLDKVRQADIINSFRISAVYRSDVTRELDRSYNLDDTPLSDRQTGQLHGFRLGYGSHESDFVMDIFLKLTGKIGYFCGIKMGEVPSHAIRRVERTIRERWLRTYDHEDGAIVEPSMILGETACPIRRDSPAESASLVSS